jgi:hypothetical protein
LLDEAVAGGELAPTDTARLARAVLAMIGGSLLQWAIDREGTLADRLSEDLDALLKSRYSPSGHRSRPSRRKRRRV